MAFPHEYQVHYRCAFELFSEKPRDENWSRVVKHIRSWISGRNPAERQIPAFGGKWFFTGGEWRAPGQTRLSVKTDKYVGNASEFTPEYWAIRYEHPDAEAPIRQWRTDIGITVVSPVRFAISLSTIHWLPPGYLGEEPAGPIPTAPGIITRLLNQETWEAHAGSERLTTAPILLRNGTAKFLIDHLEDQQRTCPLVLIARDFASGLPLLDPQRMARLLAGAAVVWESESSWVDKELAILLDRSFSCWNGMVRVYQPNVKLQSATDSRRHRYFDKQDIATLGAFKVEELLARGIVRRPRILTIPAITTVEDVQAKRATAKFAEELKKAARGSQEWTNLLEKENERLSVVVKGKDSEIERWQELAEKGEESKVEIARLKYEHSQALARAQEAESIRAALTSQVSLLYQLDRLPDSMSEIIDLMEKLYAGRIVFTEKARKSARESKLKNLNLAWKCLKSMATVLHSLHFEQKLPLREIAQKFRDSTGFEIAVGESETTRKNKKLGGLRRDIYKEESIDISPHVKHGNAPGNMLRVHYYAHSKENVLVVGHCGDHLDTVKTN